MSAREYLIWSIEHDAWWRPARGGYTRVLREAGQYSFVEATEILMRANFVRVNECLIPIEAVLSLAEVHVRCSRCGKGGLGRRSRARAGGAGVGRVSRVPGEIGRARDGERIVMMPTSLEWLAIAINFGAAGLNLWLVRRWKQRIARAKALEELYTQLIVEHMAAKYYQRLPVRDPAKPMPH